jgi:ADP-heptose:LPS heptosyltransferase
MSEISILSNQYNSVVDLTDNINNSIITFKKRKYRTTFTKEFSNNLNLSESDYNTSKEYLVKFLSFLQNQRKENSDKFNFLPEDIQQKISSIVQFDSEITSILDNINMNKDLEDIQFDLLDRIVSILDNERTILFRKLRAARG